VLADEPTGNLDPRSAEAVCAHLRAFRDEGASVVAVSHDPRLADIADRTLTLAAGEVSGTDG
jgi:ABC-type lipoprotein export system ATPase subunit